MYIWLHLLFLFALPPRAEVSSAIQKVGATFSSQWCCGLAYQAKAPCNLPCRLVRMLCVYIEYIYIYCLNWTAKTTPHWQYINILETVEPKWATLPAAKPVLLTMLRHSKASIWRCWYADITVASFIVSLMKMLLDQWSSWPKWSTESC